MFRTILIIFFLLSAHKIFAQEFWMLPDKNNYQRGDTLKVRFNVGDSFIGETWNLRAERIESIVCSYAARTDDLTSKAIGGKGDHLKIPITAEGSYVVAMKGKNAYVELDAARFNSYLKENSLDDAINQRKKSGTTDKSGKEFYVRYTKLIVQSGQKLDEAYRHKFGLPLEFIPQKNPAVYKTGDIVKFTLLYEGKPLFGARAFVWNNKGGRVYSQPIYSQQDGSIEVRLFNNGPWMISVVKMVPSKEAGADWQSYWGTIVFEVK
ncbi:MAG TPA: DUF4198 domain-containing protein [Cyclobacteriaceae bacterium]|nr:DUF4198 domain-containing protein [Cyclobacteriaceae bacterium]